MYNFSLILYYLVYCHVRSALVVKHFSQVQSTLTSGDPYTGDGDEFYEKTQEDDDPRQRWARLPVPGEEWGGPAAGRPHRAAVPPDEPTHDLWPTLSTEETTAQDIRRHTHDPQVSGSKCTVRIKYSFRARRQ